MIQFPKDLYFEVVNSKNVFELEVVQSKNIHEFSAVNTVQILGNIPIYEGDYTVEPSAHDAIVLETKDRLMENDVTVNKIRTSSTTNQYGITFYIAEVS